EIVLRPGSRVSVTVLDPGGQPVVGAVAGVVPRTFDADARGRSRAVRAAVDTAKAEERCARSDDRGAVRIEGVDVSVESTLVVLPGATLRPDLSPLVLSGWKPAATTVWLERWLSTRGVVRTPTGEPLPGVSVMRWRGPDVDVLETDADGRFAFDHEVP